MRTPADLPSTPRRLGGVRDRGRVVLISIAVIVVVLLLSARFFAGFYIEYLWNENVGRGDVFWGVIENKSLLFAMFGVAFVAIAVVNLIIADRLAPASFSANLHPVVERFHEIFGRRLRLFRIGVAVLFGLLFAIPAAGHWQDWLLFNNSKSFGIRDAQFDNDIGFYIFRLPFITFVLDWMFAAMVFITLLVLLTHILNGGVMFQPPRPKIRRATKAHMAVLLAVLAVLKAGDYWVTRYELTAERRGFVQGATYSVVNAQLPAVLLLVMIALLVAGLFLYSLKSDSWRLPLAGSALWVVMALVAGVIYPAAIQALVVNPNQRDREATYIERNITATRQALGISDADVAEKEVSFDALNASAIEKDISPLQDVRLLNPTTLVSRFRTDQGQRAGLTINDLDIDRYDLAGRTQQVIIAARELDLDTVANKSWQGTHLISTHGCGLIQAPAGQVETNGRPNYQELDLTRPELYFSEGVTGYGIVKSTVAEDVCPGQSNAGAYSGTGGVELNSVIRRMAFALSFFDYNLIGSSAIDDNSRLMWIRNVRDRVQEVAPFLSFDGDPYPVAIDGEVLWVVDGYTTSGRYPYAQNADRNQLGVRSGLDFDFNYVRNSVKAVVNAYDGSMKFYIVDTEDPIIEAWDSAFPDLFSAASEMPAGLVDHLRYPEELFRIQTAAYSKYRLSPAVFFDRTGAWSVAQSPGVEPRAAATATGTDTAADATSQSTDFAEESATARFVPYYSMFQAPDATEPSFELLRPFVPFSTDDSRKELQAFMIASSDPDTYGQMTAYVVKTDADGPAAVSATMESDPNIAQEMTLLNQNGSKVLYGDMQLVPIDGGLLYLRPLYVESATTQQPSFRYILLSYDGKASYGATMQEALAKLFPGFDLDIGDVINTDSGTPTEPDNPDTPDTPATDETPEELLARADDLFAEADAALPDFAAYAEKLAEARALVAQALALLQDTTTP